ncbi:MAG: hypothetical protein HYR90_05055 [Candidatus Andersenbacteria bacterium]|nr:hypothetical protein [Candidatus Andersenbacteria bacterium]MBI3250742.1 hypothetical protein [Candidatus Andersenbacteria bacterium]
MPSSINRLGIVVAGIAALVIVAIWTLFMGTRAVWRHFHEPAPIATEEHKTDVLSDQDTDQDGLSDDLEPIYRSNPVVADTDLDGTNDGDEVVALRDPTTAGPDDALFPENVTNNALNENTLTNKYLQTLPADAPREEVLSPEKLEGFVDQNRQQFLPQPASILIKTTTEEGRAAIEAYLNTVSSSHNTKLVFISSDDIAQAFQKSFGQEQHADLDAIIEKLKANIAILKEAAAPAEAAELHKKLVAASEALLQNVQLLRNMKVDYVAGLIGAKNLEGLATTFTEITTSIKDLESKYGLE